MYKQIGLLDVYDYFLKGRIGIAITNVKTRDPYEYTNSLLALLQSAPWIEMIKAPKLIDEGMYKGEQFVNQEWTIILILNKTKVKGYTPEQVRGLTQNIIASIKNLVNGYQDILLISRYIDKSSLRETTITREIIVRVLLGHYNSVITFKNIRTGNIEEAQIRFMLPDQCRVSHTILVFEHEIKDVNNRTRIGYETNTLKLNNSFPDIVAKSCHKPYRQCRLHPQSITMYGRNNEEFSFDIAITPKSIELEQKKH